MRSILPVLLSFALASPAGADPNGPADAIGGGDLVVYADGDVRSRYFGLPLPSPYCEGLDCQGFRWRDGVCAREDDCTRVVLKDAPGIHNAGGTYAWQVATWGRYVFTTNYLATFRQQTEAQGIGVFDSESQHFCRLRFDRTRHRNGAVQMVDVAEPDNPDRSRIYFEGVVGSHGSNPGHSFGWIEADARRNPCSTYDPRSETAGWRVVAFTAPELNARVPPNSPLDMYPCDPEGDFLMACGWDGMAVIDPETVALGNWWRRSIVVVHAPMSASRDDVRILDVYRMPLYRTPDQDNMCYRLAPVKGGRVDSTRGPGDRRVSWTFDVHCNVTQAEYEGQNCSYVPRCQYSLDPCTQLGEPCDPFVIGDLEFEQSCSAAHPMQRCSQSGRSCYQGLNRPDQSNPYCDAGETCRCFAGPKPAQEYRFDGRRLDPVSPLFRPGTLDTSGGAAVGPTPLFYDDAGGAWFGANSGSRSPAHPHSVIIYGRDAMREHRYFDSDAASSATAVVVPPVGPLDQTFSMIQWHPIARISTGAQIGRTAWTFAVALHVEQFTRSGQRWTKTEGSRVRSPAWLGSRVFDMWTGEPMDVPYEQTGARATAIAAGGSPPSVWMHIGGGNAGQRWSAFLARMPVLSPIGEGAHSEVGPAMAWSTNEWGEGRAWLFGKPSVETAYRVRDNGSWSAWYPLPRLPGAAASGISAVAGPDGVSVFVTGRSRVFRSHLSQTSCEAGSCEWTPFTHVPSSTTPFASAAMIDSEGEELLALTRSDGTVSIQRSRRSRWSGSRWEVLTGVDAATAPSGAWVQGAPWIAVRDSGGDVRVYTPRGWEAVRSCIERSDCTFEAEWCGGEWGTPPTLVFDGRRVRVFAGQTQWPHATCESVHTSLGWSPWRRIRTWARTISRPAATRVGGEIHLVTHNLEGELMQQALE
jgi:hypothetical protein